MSSSVPTDLTQIWVVNSYDGEGGYWYVGAFSSREKADEWVSAQPAYRRGDYEVDGDTVDARLSGN